MVVAAVVVVTAAVVVVVAGKRASDTETLKRGPFGPLFFAHRLLARQLLTQANVCRTDLIGI